MRRRSRIVLYALVALSSACLGGDDVAQTIVWLDAGEAARAALSRVRVQAIGPGDNRPTPVESRAPTWPIKLVLAPKDGDASRPFTLHVEADDAANRRLVSLWFESGFVPYQTRSTTLFIHDTCVAPAKIACAGGDMCNVFGVELDASKLGVGVRAAHKLDITCDASMRTTETPEQPGGRTGSAGNRAQGTAGSAGIGGSEPPVGASGSTGSTPPTTGTSSEPADCLTGYMRSGDDCVDIDECATDNPCGERGICENTGGSYTCLCEQGYQDVGGTCEDENECQTNNGGCDGPCLNSIGGMACECREGTLKADRKGCGSFGAAQPIGIIPSTEPCQPRFAFDAQGNGVAVWTQSNGTRSTLWTRRYRVGEGWLDVANRLPVADPGNASYPRIALDAQGRGAIVWVQTTESHSDVWAVRYADQSFDTPAKLEHDDAGSASLPSIALDAEGEGFAVWNQSNGTRTHIWANRLTQNGWEGASQVQRSDSQDAFSPEVAVDPSGNASLAWTQVLTTTTEDMMSTTRFYPWSMRFSAESALWGLPLLLDRSGAAGLPDTELLETNGLIVWTRFAEGRPSIVARSSDSSEATEIAPTDSDLAVAWPRIALAPSGQGAAIWAQGTTSTVSVWANRFDGMLWSTPTLLSGSDSTSLTFPQVAIDPSGDGFGVWPETIGTARIIYARRLQSGMGWLPAEPLGTDVTADPPDNSPVRIEVDVQGNAMAIWDVLDAGQYYVWANAFE